MSMFTTGNVMIPYDALKKCPPFEKPAERLQVSRRFNAIAGVSLSDEMAERGTWPEIKRTMLRPAIYDELLDVFDYIADRLHQATQLTTEPPGSG